MNAPGIMIALAMTDLVCWSGLIFFAFKWATCTCGV
mgnify:FL=1